MSLDVDQFGRSTSSNNPSADDKSKKILESLSEIKQQLSDKNYNPKKEPILQNKNHSNKKIDEKHSSQDLELIFNKIETIERTLKSIENKFAQNINFNVNSGFQERNNSINENSLFHAFDNHSRNNNMNSLIVVDQQTQKGSFAKQFFTIVIGMTLFAILIFGIRGELPFPEMNNWIISLIN
jgi:hypothetical protein